MNEFTSLGREVFALFYAKATWRCLQGGKAAEQFRPFFIITTMKHFYLRTIFAWLMMTMLFPFAIHAAEGYKDGDVFTAQTEEGIEMTFKVISVQYMTCQIGEGSFKKAAIPLMTEGNVTIPQTINGFHITSIGNYAFEDCQNITSVVFPNTLTNIGFAAFRSCSNLRNVSFPKGLVTISDWAFAYCTSLESIYIPNSVKNIGSRMLVGCVGLSKLEVEEGNTEYDSRDDCNAIILKQANSFYDTLLIGCKNTIIPNGVYYVGDFAFCDCTSLTSIVIPDSIIEIGRYAFNGCTGLEKIVTRIRNPFDIENSVFQDGEKNPLSATLYVPFNTHNLYRRKSGWNQLNIVEMEPTNNGEMFTDKTSEGIEMTFTIVDIDNKTCQVGGSVPNKEGYYYLAVGEDATGTITIPETTKGYKVIGIEAIAFKNRTAITKIIIPNDVTYVNNSAFEGCSSLSSIKFSDKLTTIGNRSFYGCSSLDSITIPNTVTSIGNLAFANCQNLTKIISEIETPFYITSGVFSAATYSNCILKVPFTKINDYRAINGWSNFKKILDSEDGFIFTAMTIEGTKMTFKVISAENRTCQVGTGEWNERAISTTTKGNITIPQNPVPDYEVTTIGWGAFMNCSSLSNIDLPTSLIEIESSAFSGCSSLEAISIPKSVNKMSYPFEGCDNLKTVIIDCEFKFHGSNSAAGSFNDNPYYSIVFGKQVEKYIIGDNVKKIGNNSFNGCTSLREVTLSKGIEIIEEGAFYRSENVKTLNIDCKAIGNWFYHISPSVTTVNLGDNVETIGDWAFSGFSGVSLITIPQNVGHIGRYAFQSCQMKSITIPEKVDTIGASAFKNCTQLAEVTLLKGNLTDIGEEAFSLTALASIALPDGVKTVGKKVFADCKQLSDVTMTNSVEIIGESAFAGCENLKNITLSENLNQISDGLFKDCSSISAVIIPSKITSIGANAFENCSNITSVNIPSSLTTIGYDAFAGCNSLEKVIVSDLTAWCGITFESNPLSIAHHLYSVDGTEITDLIIPDGVETINSYAFYGGTNFTSVKIPSSLKKIGDYSFYGCDNLSKVIVPDLTSWCNINFGSNYNSNPLSISGHLYSENEHEILDLVIPYGVQNINDGAFYGGKFSSLALPSSLKTIGNYAFSLCSNITSVVIPNGVTTIGMGAFGLCDKLAAVVIPNSVSSIGKSAFANCLSLYSVTSLINIPFNLDESAFQYLGSDYDKNIIYMAATLYVPRGRTAMYRSVQGWKNFTNIMETDTKYSLTYMLDGEVYKNYEIQATEVITPEPDPYREGYEFSGWSAIPSVMPAHDVVVTGSFTPSAGINTTSLDESTVECYYSIDGQRINTPQRGVNIIKMKDGSTKKIMVK